VWSFERRPELLATPGHTNASQLCTRRPTWPSVATPWAGCGRCDFRSRATPNTVLRSITSNPSRCRVACFIQAQPTPASVTSCEEKAFLTPPRWLAPNRTDFVVTWRRMKIAPTPTASPSLPGNLRSGKPREHFNGEVLLRSVQRSLCRPAPSCRLRPARQRIGEAWWWMCLGENSMSRWSHRRQPADPLP